MNAVTDTPTTPLAVIGAGPAGLAAAAAAAEHGVAVTLLDEQPDAGGQIYRGVTRAGRGNDEKRALGDDYWHGQTLVDALAKRPVERLYGATVWQLTPEREIFYSRNGQAQVLRAEQVVLATGALERPMPFPGWTAAGVMTVGAGQTLLKASSLVAGDGLVLAGSGPLLLLVAAQTLRAGGRVRAIVDTTPTANYRRAMPLLPGALRAAATLRKGLGLLREVRAVARYPAASELRADVDAAGRVRALAFRSRGRQQKLDCDALWLHVGVVPNVQITRSLDLPHDWDPRQRCWRPRLQPNGATELDGIAVAGDGGGINGAPAAQWQGRLAGLSAAGRLGTASAQRLEPALAAARRRMQRERYARAFLDTLYAPAAEFLDPPDDTVVCRCEEVTAGQLRAHVAAGCLGPNQTKAFGRAGMGPCQGRLCGLTVSEIIAGARRLSPAEVGYYRIRSPIKPVTLGELASLPIDDGDHI